MSDGLGKRLFGKSFNVKLVLVVYGAKVYLIDNNLRMY